MMLFLLLVGAYIFLWYVREKNDSKKRPPGPMQFPVVGSMIQVAIQHPVGFIALHKLAKKYGDCMSVKLGTVNYAIVSSYDSIKYFYAGEDCVDRPCSGIWKERNFNKPLGILFSNGKMWYETRKFCTLSSRANGFMNRAWLKDLLKEEMIDFTEYLDNQIKSNPNGVVSFTPSGIVKISMTNLICASIDGERHSLNNKELQDLVVDLDKFFRASTLGISVMMAYPWLRFVLGRSLGYNDQMDCVRGIHKYSSKLIKKHRELGEYKNGEATNFIDSFLQKMDETKNDPNTSFTEEQFLVVVTDFFTAGAETTANVLLFAILLLMSNPDKQEKLYNEIHKVLGDRAPEIEDKDNMIYTQAVIHEVHRWAKVTISLGPREATKDIEYEGKIIKKGDTVLANIYPVLQDPEYFGDVNVFQPERFITPDGKLQKTERLIQFGLGKRICFGEILARESAFIYLTTLIQRYKFEMPDEYRYKKPSLKLLEGITTCPVDFRAKLVRRV